MGILSHLLDREPNPLWWRSKAEWRSLPQLTSSCLINVRITFFEELCRPPPAQFSPACKLSNVLYVFGISILDLNDIKATLILNGVVIDQNRLLGYRLQNLEGFCDTFDSSSDLEIGTR